MAEVKKFQSSPYFDDFDEKNNFLRVLFRPSYAVQTRELNQLQTILQDQIGIISDYALEDRTRVIGGETHLINELSYIKLSNDATLGGSLDQYIGADFTAANGVTGTIMFITDSVDNDPITLYVKYISSANDGVTKVPANASNITITDINSVQSTVPTASINATGNGSAIVLNEGIFYVDKSFIRTDRQMLLLNKYDTVLPEDEISAGFIVENVIVKPEMDISLLDNATGAPNETAPGAHRHKAEIVLVLKTDVAADKISEYIELIKIRNGEIAAKPRVDNEFAVLEQILARRLYDQSGDYIVSDFNLDIREHLKTLTNDGIYTPGDGGDSNKLAFKLDAGVAYVRGFEVRPEGNSIIDVPKARTTAFSENSILQTQYKNNFVIHTLSSVPQLSAKLKLINGSMTIGTAFVHGCTYLGERDYSGIKKVYQLDVFGVVFTGGSWGDVTKVEYDDSVSAVYPFEASVADFVNNAHESSLVYKLPYDFTQSVTPRVTTFYKEISTTSVGPIVNVSLSIASETLDDEPSSYLVFADYDSGKVGTPSAVSMVDSQNATINIQNIVGTATPGNVPVRILVKTFCTAPPIRTKSKVSSFVNSGLAAAKSVKLSKADAIQLISVMAGSVDVTDSYTLDTGARDTHYDFASINLKPGEALPSGTLTVTFSYFEHGASGDFFAPTSYTDIGYENIPYYTNAAGEKIFLGSAIDYRQRLTAANVMEHVGRHSFVADQQMIADVTYYLGRADRIMLTNRGEFINVMGNPSVQPQLPNEVNDAITLYTVNIPPYTMSTDVVSAMRLNHRRYTMKDIVKLDNRLSTVEEVALLTSLERDVLEVDFEDRFKSGFVADNFATAGAADFSSPDFKVAIDILNNEIRPMATSQFIDVNVSDVESSGIKVHDNGQVTLNYTTKKLISQPMASTAVRIQPYMTNQYIGDLTLVPGSDIWFETEDTITNTNVHTHTNTQINRTFVNGRLHSQTSSGSSTSSSSVATTVSKNSFDGALIAGTWNFVSGAWRNAKTGATATSAQSRELANLAKTSKGDVNTITINQEFSAIPYIRSRTVTFRGYGLKPNTVVYPSFDGVDVSAHCRLGIGALGGQLKSGPSGMIEGTFTIPESTFKTGSRSFVLKDNPNPKSDYIDTIASFVYTAEGTFIQESADIRSTTSSENVSIRSTYIDPLAQSFFIEESICPGGAFIKAIDIYVAPFTKNSDDITIDIRRMYNGYPGAHPIYNHAIARIKAADIAGSYDATTKVTATFESPVYLPAGEEYAFVVLSNSETLAIWCSELGKAEVRPGDTVFASGEIIAKQPYLGSMFKSQNNTTWTAEQMMDIKFDIHRCNFVSSGSIVFTNEINQLDVDNKSNIYRKQLVNNPLYFTSGQSTIYVSAWGHGMSVGDSFKLIKDDATNTYFGINHDVIFNTILTVTSTDLFGFSFNVGHNATATGRHGSYNVYVDNWATPFSYAQVLSDEFTIAGTNVRHSLSAKRIDNYASAASGNFAIISDNMFNMGDMFVVKQSGDRGVVLTTSISTNLDNVSPIVNKDRFGINAVANVVNNTPLLGGSGNRQDKSSPARYIQKQVTLVNPANELRVYLNANLPAGTVVNAYYKVGQNNTNEQSEWIKMDVESSLRYTDDPSKFYEQKFIKQFANEFQAFTVMIEMLSSSKLRVPRIKDYRAFALNG